MSKFKIGDKVLRTGCSATELGLITGEVYVVKAIPPQWNDFIILEGVDDAWDQDKFELIEEAPKETSPSDDSVSELEEAYARIDSLEELVSSLSDDRTQLLKAIKEMIQVLDENKCQLDSTDFEGIVYAQGIYNKMVKPELE